MLITLPKKVSTWLLRKQKTERERRWRARERGGEQKYQAEEIRGKESGRKRNREREGGAGPQTATDRAGDGVRGRTICQCL